MLTYAESSAVAAWILDQPRGDEVESALSSTSDVACSDLTLFECDRTIHRLQALGHLSGKGGENCRRRLAEASRSWHVTDISAGILAEAQRRFPLEPVRSLDAIHLGTALWLNRKVPEVVIVTLDERVADNAALLGFEVLPPRPPDR